MLEEYEKLCRIISIGLNYNLILNRCKSIHRRIDNGKPIESWGRKAAGLKQFIVATAAGPPIKI